MVMIQMVNVLFLLYIDFIRHRMETVYFGTVLISDPATSFSSQLNMIFFLHPLNMHGLKEIFNR